MTEDIQLITRLKQGDLDALGRLYDRYRLNVFRTAFAITGDKAVADDILQEVFLRLHAHADRVNPARPLMPWLYRVTVNLSQSWVNRHRRWWVSIDEWVEQLIGPAHFSPEPAFERDADNLRMQQAFDKLPVGQRVVATLYYLNDVSLQEIAEILNCPLGTIKSRLHQARETLRQQLTAPTATLEVQYEFT